MHISLSYSVHKSVTYISSKLTCSSVARHSVKCVMKYATQNDCFLKLKVDNV